MGRLNVNGIEHELQGGAVERLSTVLRSDLGLLGVHVSCAEGECGACTVLVDGEPMTACLMLARQAEGRAVVTIEGLGGLAALHPIQEAFVEEQSFQCAFCTPGFVMATKAFLERNPDPTPEQAAAGVSGNICRCGAYPYIVQGVLTAAAKLRGEDTTGRPPSGVIPAPADQSPTEV